MTRNRASAGAATEEAAHARWIDCSQPLRAGLPQPWGAPGFELRTIRDVADGRSNMQQLRMLTHHATHVDAPIHFVRGAPRIDELPLETFWGPGVVVEASAGPLATIPVSLFADAAIAQGDIVLVRTSWSRHYGDPEYDRAPYLASDVAALLVERRIKALGIDTISPDEGPHPARPADPPYPIHNTLLRAGIVIIENLDLLRLPAGRCEVMALPIRVTGGDGAPARVVGRPVRS